MYIFLRVAGHTDSMKLARRLIDEAGLGLAPGKAFGPEAEGRLRWCYASTWSKNEIGVERLAKFLSLGNARDNISPQSDASMRSGPVVPRKMIK